MRQIKIKPIQGKKRLSLYGYLAAPHELLHVFGYRLVGRPCRYQLGDTRVIVVGPMTQFQRLVGMLFPFFVLSIICIIAAILSGFAYRYALQGGSIFWFILFTTVTLISGGYAGTAIGDLRNAYLFILKKPMTSWTPFDIFFWPAIDWEKIRRQETRKNDYDSSD